MNHKIAALIRTQSDRSLTTLANLVAAHLNLFGHESTVATQEELVAAASENADRMLRLELSGSLAQEGGAELKRVEQSLAHAAKRAGVPATFELFLSKDREPPAAG